MNSRPFPRARTLAQSTALTALVLSACTISVNNADKSDAAGGALGSTVNRGGGAGAASIGTAGRTSANALGGNGGALVGTAGTAAAITSGGIGGAASAVPNTPATAGTANLAIAGAAGASSNQNRAGNGTVNSAGNGTVNSAGGVAGLAGLGGSMIASGGLAGTSVSAAGSSAIAGAAGIGSSQLVWSAGKLGESSTETVISPKIAIAPNGNVMAVWAQSDGKAQSIYANRFLPGAGWETPILLETSDMPADSPRIAADGNGNFIAAWHQAWNVTNGTECGIYANRYVAGVGWGTTSTVYVDTSTESVTANSDLQIAADPAGNAVVAFGVYDWSWNHTSVRANRYLAGTGWSGVTNLSSESVQFATAPAVAMDGSGNTFVLWEQSTGTTKSVQGVQAARATLAKGWETPALIESSAVATDRSGSAPQVAFDNNGNAIAIWYQYGKPGIFANRWSKEGGWGTPVSLPEPEATGYAEGAKLAFDGQGNAMAVWNRYGGILFANRYTVGTGWGKTEIADSGYSDYSGNIALCPNGNALAVWGQYSRNSYNIWANRYTLATGWGSVSWEQSIINQPLDYAEDPQLVIDRNGLAIVVWIHNKSLYAATASPC